MTTNDCAARLNAMLNNIPPVRYVPNSPYPTYTQYELDMRRKAEILKYKKNSTQSNGITQKQKYTQIVKSVGRQTNVTQSLNNQCSVIDSPTVFYPPLPASYSGVPGGGMLYCNPNIPVYNYKESAPSYGITNNLETIQY